MSRVVTGTTVFPVWLLVFGLVTAMSPPLTVSGLLVLLLVGLAIPAIVLLVWKETPPTVSEVLRAAEINNRERNEPNTHRSR